MYTKTDIFLKIKFLKNVYGYFKQNKNGKKKKKLMLNVIRIKRVKTIVFLQKKKKKDLK